MKYKLEKDPSDYVTLSRGSTKITMPNTRNSGHFALVDSSTNGFGMVAANTRPIFVDPENTGYWYLTYRQYAGENTTHGQLGGAFSEDGEDYQTYPNLNANGNPPWGGGGIGGSGVGQARYPSSVGTEDIPVSIWNEYTGLDPFGIASYGGMPFYTYDEFGWDGGSFAYPIDMDPLWYNEGKDLWVGSTSISYDDDLGMPVINAVYNDWTRGDRWLFHSEYVDGETIIMGEEQKVIDEVNDLVGGDDTGSFNTSPYVSCTPEGICGVGLIGLFIGADNDASDITDEHTGIFKMSEDHGYSWHGCDGSVAQGCAPSSDGDNYYFIPDAVWADLVSTQFGYEYVDECDGTTVMIDSFWSYYEDDFKVDREGNPHFAIQVLGCDSNPEGFCYYEPNSGVYHFTINRDYLDNPGPVNTPTGWNWSFVITGNDTWGFSDLTGDTYIWVNHNSLAFSVDDPDVLYVVTNMATKGEWAGTDEDFDDPCYFSDWEDYPAWSEDIYIVKSEDGGQTWWNPLNVSNTPDEGDGTGASCPNSYPKCDPAEEYPHAAQWATNDEVYFMYQMPNWAFNEIGDLFGADFMNRVYSGYAIVDDSDIPEYGVDDSCYAEVGDVTDDGIINILDIISVVNHVLGNTILVDLCAADYNADGTTNILDIIEMVNYVLGIGLSVEHTPATKASVYLDSKTNYLSVNANGYIQGVQLTIKHDADFNINMNEDIYIAEYHTNGNETTIIVVTNGDDLADIDQIAEIQISNAISIIDAVAITVDNQEISLNLSNRDENYEDFSTALPNGYRVNNAYPNPFNPTTTFKVDLDNQKFVSIKAYNVIGQLVAEVFSGNLNGYNNNINWDASNVSSGIYFIKVQVGDHLESQKVLLVK